MGEAAALHVTNGDAVVPEIVAAVQIPPASVLVWRDVLHDGPVPADLDADALARVRAHHLAARRGWPYPDEVEVSEDTALAMLRERDSRLASHPAEAEVVLWFEHDLFDDLLLAQVEHRLAGRPGPVTRVHLAHPPRGDLRAAFEARELITPDPAPFAALCSPDPRQWTPFPAFSRLLEELPDAATGLTRLERQILESLAEGPLTPSELFQAVAAQERPPWIGDAPLFALAADLDPLVTQTDGAFELTPAGQAVLTGAATRPPINRWLGGVHLGPGHADWTWEATTARPVRRD
jgi:hypothetical protein